MTALWFALSGALLVVWALTVAGIFRRHLDRRRTRSWLANDLGLLAEEYDVGRQRQVGNFPQAFSHLTLRVAAREISAAEAGTESAPR